MLKKLSPTSVFAVISGCLFFFTVTVNALIFGTLSEPPSDNDELYFEILAANLAIENSFSGKLSPAVLELYTNTTAGASLAPGGAYREEMQLLGITEVTTFRPPLYPYLISLAYRVFGRDFIVSKLVNICFVATGVAVIGFLLRSYFTLLTATLVLTAMLLDPMLNVVARLRLSESLAFLIISLLLLTLLLPRKKPWLVLVAALLGLAILTRPVFLFWLPLVAMATAHRLGGSWRSQAAVVAKICLLSLLVALPWFIRNCLLANSFMPLGSQGGILLGMIFLNDPIPHNGNWHPDQHFVFLHNFSSDLQGFAREVALAKQGNSYFANWFWNNFNSLPKLVLLRIYSLWWEDAMPLQICQSILGISGILIWRKNSILLVLLLLAQTLAIAICGNAARHSAPLYGRYLFALSPVFFLGLGSVCDRILSSIRKHSPNSL